ncbi:MAG: hypothetical protein V8R75_02070 [Oscillospiraceae bacterium]
MKQTHKFFGSKEHRAGIRGIDIVKQLIEECGELGVEMMLTYRWQVFIRERRWRWTYRRA